jgi:hypothetical protein
MRPTGADRRGRTLVDVTHELYQSAATLEDVTELEDAWNEIHVALPTGWTVIRPPFHREEAERPWHVFAVDLRVVSQFAIRVAVRSASVQASREVSLHD